MTYKGIRGISFDLWGTLINANPEYTVARAETLARFMEYEGVTLSLDAVKEKHRVFKQSMDAYSSITGKQIPTNVQYRMLYHILGGDYSPSKAERLKKAIRQLVYDIPPIPIDGVMYMLDRLHSDGYELAICSNTNLIQGIDLVGSFAKNGIELFGHMGGNLVFSDNIGVAKPHIGMFEAVLHKLSMVGPEVLHVGDTHIADGGCEAAHMNYLLVNNPGRPSITDLPKKLEYDPERVRTASIAHH